VKRKEPDLSFCGTGKGDNLSMKEMSDILLVEDNKYNVEFILDALNNHNLARRVKVFRDGGEALDYLFAVGEYSDRDSFEQPSVILLDLRLPKVDGLEVLRMLRSNEATKMIPVVVFSSSTNDQDRIDSYRLGANSFIVKPIAYDRFVETVTEIGSYWALQNAPP
jgi:two-component system, response regulator